MTGPLIAGHGYRQLATALLELAKKQGADQADVMIADGDQLSVQVRLGEVDRVTKAREKRLGLRVFFGKRSASTATSDFTPESLEQLVTDTCTLARAVAEDPHSSLPDPEQMARDVPELDLHDATMLSADAQIALARRAETAAMQLDPRIINSEGADFSSSHGRILLANTQGFIGEYPSSSFVISTTPVAKDPAAAGMQRDSWYAIDRKFAKLESPEAVGQEAGRRTIRRLGARKVKTQRAPVVFDPDMAATLVGHLCAAVSGSSLYKGASFLIDHLGKPLFPEFVTIADDGRLPGALGSRPFDGEGLPTRRTTVVEHGVLHSYLLDTYTGRKLGLPSTGNASRAVGENPSVGPSNFYLAAGNQSPIQIMGSVSQGLYVTELIGFGVNMVTGDYSRGAAGFWIEGGELAYPVEEITIAGNLKEIFGAIEMVGNDLVFRGRVASPTVKIGEMTIAGN